MKNKLTKKQALSTGNNQDIIDYILLENGIDPNLITDKEYNKYKEIIYQKLLAEQN